jgi:peptidyl-dipeptidase A
MNPAFYLTILFVHNCASLSAEEARAKKFLDGLNKRGEDRTYRLKMAKWGYDSNITDSNLQQVVLQSSNPCVTFTNLKKSWQITVTSKLSEEEKQDWQELMKFDWQSFQDYDLKRQFEKNSHLGLGSLPKDKIKRYNTIVNEMTKIYSTSKICAFDDPTKCDLALEPNLVNILANSRNPDQLKHVWVEWRNAVGPHCKNLFSEYVELGNEAARLGNFTDTSDQWLHSYEDSKIMDKVEELWKQLRPLYLQIHAYVRTHLRKTYGDLVTEKGPIPAHLLGEYLTRFELV